jgi:hypothetical protein
MTALDFPTSPVAGQEYNGFVWDDVVGAWKPFNIGNYGFKYVDTVYFTSSGTFTKATYPWLRAIRVRVQGAGGGGGGTPACLANQSAVGGGGGGGVYSESFITNIAGLDASVTVTRGAGGAGGAAGLNNGSAGGNSSFGSLVSANGGPAGGAGPIRTVLQYGAIPAAPATTGVGDLVLRGGAGESGLAFPSTIINIGANGGASFLAQGGFAAWTGGAAAGGSGSLGSGGGGAATNASSGNADGGDGGNGIVIVELYA